MPGCKVGDIAVITQDPENPSNVGAFVRVLALSMSDYGTGMKHWEIGLLGEGVLAVTVYENGERTDHVGHVRTCDHQDEYLDPIRPAPQDTNDRTSSPKHQDEVYKAMAARYFRDHAGE